jgi:hypothetical protein
VQLTIVNECPKVTVPVCVLFIMAKINPVRSSQIMKSIRDVHSFFQEESFKIRSNQPI